MARTDTSNFSDSTIPLTGLASSVIPRTNFNQTKDPLQRSDIVKTEFFSREGLYKNLFSNR